ncbi:hypothetical protein MLD38_005852 [Melastoma candidum]|uniref:Uncharacterized protein n=1 Tax=Melastoma candidum TaxID=119954 RepID=A0ACB9RKM1_9MYRT|nr:hypothetical protein MLD38_005852 [Melastoma candidum]
MVVLRSRTVSPSPSPSEPRRRARSGPSPTNSAAAAPAPSSPSPPSSPRKRKSRGSPTADGGFPEEAGVEDRGDRRAEKGKGKVGEGSLDGAVVETRGCGGDAGGSGTSGGRRRRRYSAEEKGKGQLVEEMDGAQDEPVEVPDIVSVDDSDEGKVDSPGRGTRVRVTESDAVDFRERFKSIARRNASRFAHFNEEEFGGRGSGAAAVVDGDVGALDRVEVVAPEEEDWPGPFSTAMKIIRDREMKSSAPMSKDKSACQAIHWVPRRGEGFEGERRMVPSLQDLCMRVLLENVDAVTSIEGLPDMLRHRLCQLLCDSRKMNDRFFNILVKGVPTELRVIDCSWLTEEQLSLSLNECDMSNLTVLQLDQCGRCLPDYIMSSSLARGANSLPALSSISITGACRLTDSGLKALVSSAPNIRSINLSQCSLLTSAAIQTLANSLGAVLKELYLDDCQRIDIMVALPALKKLEHLEVLSLAGIQSVNDDFIRELLATQGPIIKELILDNCTNLTDLSCKLIAEACPSICSLSLVNLDKLTDSALGYLANASQGIQKLYLRRNAVSDEAIAAFLETSGEQLEVLSLNNLKKVGHNTALSLSRRARKLQSLDLSWCRNLTDQAMGLIVDSCLSLREVKVFGCTQITEIFLEGHVNPSVHIIGPRNDHILKHQAVPTPECILRYS